MSQQDMEDIQEPESNDPLERLRHSCAHLMAHAISKMWPTAQFGIGPAIENGFYYDVLVPETLTPVHLKRIEKEMRKLASQKKAFVRQEHSISEAKELFQKLNQPFKLEIIDTLATNLGATTVSTYQEGDFVDLCRGPHVESTADISVFSLMSVSGAFWRGKEGNPQLQRVYGTAFFTQAELDEYLHLLEEAKKRDHRKLGRELDLFSFQPEAPASPFFHPKGTIVYNRLVQYVRTMYDHYGYTEVITPQIFDSVLWKKSGHYDNYVENMYFTQVDEREFAVKPMNCPAHTFIYSSAKRSYRDLPLRIADFGRLHRYERSGATAGLTRVRTFCQDDAHVFCTSDQIAEEIRKVIEMITISYEMFGFDLNGMKVGLSTRPEKRVGSDQLWDEAESALKSVLDNSGRPYSVYEGDGAFYGPKIDFLFTDALKRQHQLATIQLDFTLPERFDLNYTGSDNSAHRPVMIHRAVLGSIERFMGVYIEHTAGIFPFWLTPVQARVIPINEAHRQYCADFVSKLKAHGLRVELDDRNESMGLKTREAQMSKIPFTLVAGDREIEAGSFAVRTYGSRESEVLTLDAIEGKFLELHHYAENEFHKRVKPLT